MSAKKASVGKVAAAKKPARVSNEVKLDANNPIPFANNRKAFSYSNSAFYIPFIGNADGFGIDLLEATLLSTTHQGCINKKSSFCAGIGFQDVQGRELPQGVKDWFKSINLKNQSAVEISKSAFGSFFTFGNVPIEVVRFSVGKKKKLFVYVHNFLEWRLCEPDDNDIPQEAIQSKAFLKNVVLTAKDLQAARKLPLYSPHKTEKSNWVTDDKGVQRTLIWHLNPMTGFPYYGMPSAIASLIFQILEYKGARYNLDNFDNNMVVSAILAIKGSLSQPEADRIAKKIVNNHTGDGKRGRVVAVASEDGIDGSEFHTFDTHKEGSYVDSDDKWSQKIIMANEWDSVLLGVLDQNSLGKGSGFITKIYEHVLNTVIKPAQSNMMEKVWNPIFKIASEWLSLPFDQFEFEIKNAIDISGLTDVDITNAVQVNEVRKAKGLPEDKKMKGVYMSKGNQQQGGANNVQP